MRTIDDSKAAELAERFYRALRERRMLPPISAACAGLTLDDAYSISLAFLGMREADGERVVGKKIGLTSKAVQDMLGVNQPDLGFLTDAMAVADGASLSFEQAGLIQPRAEAEIAFILKQDLMGTDISEQDVLDATGAIAPCFEIVDSRIENWNIGIIDTVADNASCGVFSLGEARADPREFDLARLKITVRKNGKALSEGFGAASLGSPLAAVCWLANTLLTRGVPLLAGDIILSGSLVPLEPIRRGDHFEMDLLGVGGAAISFI